MKRKLLIVLLAIIALVLIVVLCVLINIKGKGDKGRVEPEPEPYTDQLYNLEKAAENRNSLENFVMEKIDLKAVYALAHAEYDYQRRTTDLESFSEIYSLAKEEEYLIELYDLTNAYYNKVFKEQENVKMKISKIEPLEDTTRDDKQFNVKGMKRCEVYLINSKAGAGVLDRYEIVYGYFWNGKLIHLGLQGNFFYST